MSGRRVGVMTAYFPPTFRRVEGVLKKLCPPALLGRRVKKLVPASCVVSPMNNVKDLSFLFLTVTLANR